MDCAGQLLPNEDRRRALSIAVPRRPRAARPRRGSPLAALRFPERLHLPVLPRGMPARGEGLLPTAKPYRGHGERHLAGLRARPGGTNLFSLLGRVG